MTRWNRDPTQPAAWVAIVAACAAGLVFPARSAAMLTHSGPAASPRTVTLYVSPSGNDSWSGRSARVKAPDGPFATVARAQRALRSLRARGELHGPATVYLRGGRYALAEPIVFTPEDSGTRAAPATFAAYRNETPILTGDRPVTGWRAAGSGLWSTGIPSVKDGSWYFRELFVGDHRRPRSRLPHTGFFHMAAPLSEENPPRFGYQGEDVRKAWAGHGEVEVVSPARWVQLRVPIASIDDATKTVTLSGPVDSWAREENQRYYLESLPEGLDAPGSWYLDRAAGVLTYHPLPGERMESAEAYAPVLEQLLRIEGDPAHGRPVSFLRFRGLGFAHTAWAVGPHGDPGSQASIDVPAAFQAEGAHDCAVERCAFFQLGGYAVEFGRGCRGNSIARNEMTDLGGGGVKIGEGAIRESPAEQAGENTVSDNRIHDIGVVFPAAVGVWVGQSAGNRIVHNAIYDTFYSALSVGWTWGYGRTLARDNLIAFNDAYNIGRGLLSDMGAIYTLGVQPGTVIRNNRFHDVSSATYGGWGIYPDEGSSDLLIENNVVYRTKTGGFHQHYGANNLVRNNVFALGEEGQIIRTRQEDHVSFTFERNVVYWRDGPLLGSNWAGDATFRIDDNLYWRAGGGPIDFAGVSLDAWRKRGHDLHSILADPRFVDPAHGDFGLKPGSPAARIGFRPIDLSAVGPREEPHRAPTR